MGNGAGKRLFFLRRTGLRIVAGGNPAAPSSSQRGRSPAGVEIWAWPAGMAFVQRPGSK